ncbi:hypothetical protein PAECIP111893_00568 [Paenibacillus plantiphilus]|uniref:Uncharacterized protein n=1 Tax=Paenibacillus plantiphilus TaxID=2905650 RepID=A0ABN8FZI2_9BACL|nr:hypothetical protein [Paenibacillus plantiphilus]CAH1193847.1 hypothetical protein PAECIP111893_00568 [Paenibacillus plantiphilus]
MWILLAIVVVVIVWLIVAFMRLRKSSRQRIADLGALHTVFTVHASGLPIPAKIMTRIYACEDKLIFESNKGNHEIPNERIIKYSASYRRHGALTGGSTSKKEYLIVHYMNRDGRLSAISFDCKGFRAELYVSQLTEVLSDFRRQRGLPDPNEDSHIL